MPIYELTQGGIIAVAQTSFDSSGVLERRDLQRLLRANIGVIAPQTLIISEEFGDWDDSKRRIDLLGIDKSANLVVIELKRTDDGGHMELQSIRYAAMVSKMTFEQAVGAYARYLKQLSKDDDAKAAILDFLEWDEPDDALFAQDVRIILASADFSKEVTSSVMWLNERDIDIRCVRLTPYKLNERILVDVQQIIPLPEAAEYQVQVREKTRSERQARTGGADYTRFDLRMNGQVFPSQWKRNAIFLVCKALSGKSASPDEIARLFAWRSNRVWYQVDGNVDSTKFEELARSKASSGGLSFEPGRWFCADDELVRHNNKTYAFSKMWGGDNWRRAMDLLQAKYPALGIEFSPIASQSRGEP